MFFFIFFTFASQVFLLYTSRVLGLRFLGIALSYKKKEKEKKRASVSIF
jgi:hypothetical protein